MERKTYSGHVKLTGSSGTGSAVIATLNTIDKDGNVSLPASFSNQTAHVMPMHVWQSADVPFLGVAHIREVGNEVVADFSLNMELDRAKRWRSALKFALDHGVNVEWSHGFRALDQEYGTFNGKRVRFLKRVEVFEVSPVLLGAGENTRTLTMKSLDLSNPNHIPLEGSTIRCEGCGTMAMSPCCVKEAGRCSILCHDCCHCDEKSDSGMSPELRAKVLRQLAKFEYLKFRSFQLDEALREKRLQQFGPAGPCTYVVLAAKSVPDSKWSLVQRIATKSANALGISVPKVRFFVEADHNDLRRIGELMHFESSKDVTGVYFPSEPDRVYVRANLNEYDMTATVAHETAHAAGAGDEAAAEEFENRMVKQFFPSLARVQ